MTDSGMTITEFIGKYAESGRATEGIYRDAAAAQVASWFRVLDKADPPVDGESFLYGVLMGGHAVRDICRAAGMDDRTLQIILSGWGRSLAEGARQMRDNGGFSDMSDELIESVGLQAELEAYRLMGGLGQ